MKTMIISGIETTVDEMGLYSYSILKFPYEEKPYYKIAVYNARERFQMGYLKDKKGEDKIYNKECYAIRRLNKLTVNLSELATSTTEEELAQTKKVIAYKTEEESNEDTKVLEIEIDDFLKMIDYKQELQPTEEAAELITDNEATPTVEPVDNDIKYECLNFFNETLNKIKRSINVFIPIIPCDHETIKGHTEALGICHGNYYEDGSDWKAEKITIDEYFIEECYKAERDNMKFLLFGESLISVICHEIAHIYERKHGKKHKELTQRLISLIEADNNQIPEFCHSCKCLNTSCNGTKEHMTGCIYREPKVADNGSSEPNNKTLIKIEKDGKILQVEVYDEYFDICGGIKVNAYISTEKMYCKYYPDDNSLFRMIKKREQNTKRVSKYNHG